MGVVAASVVLPGRRHPFIWVVGCAAAVTLAAFGWAAAGLVRHGGAEPSVGWTAARQGAAEGWHVSDVEANGPAHGVLQSGDRLLALNGDTTVARNGGRFHFITMTIGESYVVRVARGGAAVERTLPVVAGERHLALLLTYFLASLVWCVVGLFIGFARPGHPVARLAFAAAVATGLLFLKVNVLPAQTPGLAWAPLHMVLGYHFFCRFPSGALPGRGWRGLLLLLYAGGVGVASVRAPIAFAFLTRGKTAAARWAGEHVWLLETSRWPGLAVGLTALVAMIAVIRHNYRALAAPERRRVRWVAYSSVAGLSPSVVWTLLVLLERVAPGAGASAGVWLVLSLAVIGGSVAIPLAVAYAVLKHRVFDIAVVVRRGVQYLLAKRALQLLLALPAVALLIAVVTSRDRTIAQVVTQSPGYLYWLAAAAASLRFRRPLREWLDRRFFREQHDRERVLIGLLGEIGRLEDPSDVSRLVRAHVEYALHPKAFHLWLRDAAGSADVAAAPGELLVAFIDRERAVLDVPVSGPAALAAADARWLDERGVRLIVPLVGEDDRLAGALFLGEKESEEPYGAGDRTLLATIAKQIVAVREHLRLKARVSEEGRIRREVLARLDPAVLNLVKECPSCGACFDSSAERCSHDGQPLSLTLPVERTVDGRYRLEHLIGRGGMGAVYEAFDMRLERVVAIKFLLGPLFSHEVALRRFQREARAVARLDHPNVVRVYDYGSLEDRGAYLVMERVHGQTLRAEFDRVGALPGPVAADWFEQLLDGVAAAHAEQIVHRDLKPENVVGQRQPIGSLSVKVLDFGVAKVRSPDATTDSLTQSGVVLGTLGYMSPEQLMGGEVDARSDLFTVGVMVAEALTGRRPFRAETYGACVGAVVLDAYHLPGSDEAIRALDAVLQRCLAKEAGDRVASAVLLRRELIPALRACPGLPALAGA